MNKNIVVIGSSNTDMVIRSEKLPKPGETVLGGEFLMNPGGKGANQAVAAAKLGGDVALVAKVGDDLFGREAKSGFADQGIDTSCMLVDEETPSGVALIMVDEDGENSIAVAPGANGRLSPDDIDQVSETLDGAAYLLMQLEIPLETVEHAARLAAEKEVKVILNPAPAQGLPDDLLRSLFLITPNQNESRLLTGIEVTDEPSAEKAAAKLRDRGVDTVIITLGADGAYIVSDEINERIPAPKVEAADTTAAGDTFNGALAVALAEGQSLVEAVRFANRAAAWSVTKMGAQNSAPLRSELKGNS